MADYKLIIGVSLSVPISGYSAAEPAIVHYNEITDEIQYQLPGYTRLNDLPPSDLVVIARAAEVLIAEFSRKQLAIIDDKLVLIPK